ncbi:MAG: hypothetical protein LBU08_03030 [Tannerellaceae bacterium]|jgi:hypothetical protein|nr:hypothetical protein [Tannerellaceae bacterium]
MPARDFFFYYLRHTSSLSEDTLTALQTIVDDFPYFTAARVLLLRNLLKLESHTFIKVYNQEKVYLPHNTKLSLSPQALRQTTHSEPLDHLEAFLSAHAEPSDPDKPIASAPVSDYFTPADTLSENIPGWNKLDNFISDTGRTERFRKKISQPLPTDTPPPLPPLPALPLPQDDDFLTETLAQVFIQQGNYPRALEIFNKLRLKYPEKEDYFAARIRSLQNML